MTSREIRQSFLDFFASKGHRIVPSAPVIPHGDPTLLFTNAGMNQFKDVFLGTGKRDYTRAADTQKCIRVSGKHNDLEEVGYDTYHHTLFEMLGNWSFGDYYKKEAIGWSWELLTDVWKLPKERIHATVYRTDDESYEIWKNYLPESHIHRFDEKDNFWEMGETGPCGPCTEIHFDKTPDLSGGPLVNAGVPEVMEIWNNVFIQYNRKADGSLEDLTSRHVDTGMGFERICAVMQGKDSNYDTDVFTPLLQELENLSGRKYSQALDDKDGIAMRVIADHIRTLSFAIADGAIPGNEGRSYVLRRILRRASRYSRNLGFKEPVLFKLVQILVDTMGDVFPEIKTQQKTIERIIRAEEESFLQTLERGLERFDEIVARMPNEQQTEPLQYHESNDLQRGMAHVKHTVISGADAFQLYDTFGFPLDLTELIARERGLSVDTEGFTTHMNAQRERSRQARKEHVQQVELPAIDAKTEFTGYDELETPAQIVFVKDNQIVLDKSPFYVEMGGQAGDVGALTIGGEKYPVLDVRKSGDAIIHFLESEIEVAEGSAALAQVDAERRWAIHRNHSATHLVHEAMRKVLGNHVQQAGSLVAPDYLRFDFSHFQKVTPEELRDIEQMVNEKIFERIPVITLELPIEEARKVPNVKMFFGDKYGDKVRVVIIDEKFSAEFCGGTHVRNSSEIGLFKITSEASIASGVRRLEAVTGWGIEGYIQNLNQKVASERANADQLLEKIKQLEKEVGKFKLQSLTENIPALIEKAEMVGDVKVVAARIDIEDMEQLRSIGEKLRDGFKKGGIGLIASVSEGKAQLVCVVTDDLLKTYQAGKIVGAVAKQLGGGGGGKPQLATAGGKDVEKLPEVLKGFAELVKSGAF
ncbi:MAG TPA: alanine--tRNA ligase [Patescibacteria group bacterium]|nr:alanine--tRNA ligase [Patescibacteria group bacterium]